MHAWRGKRACGARMSGTRRGKARRVWELSRLEELVGRAARLKAALAARVSGILEGRALGLEHRTVIHGRGVLRAVVQAVVVRVVHLELARFQQALAGGHHLQAGIRARVLNRVGVAQVDDRPVGEQLGTEAPAAPERREVIHAPQLGRGPPPKARLGVGRLVGGE